MVVWINHYPWYQLLEVDPRKLESVARRQRAIKTEKILPLIKKIQEGGEIDAPIISKGCQEAICFVDGIHRTLAAIQEGLPTIKIAVRPEELNFIIEHL